MPAGSGLTIMATVRLSDTLIWSIFYAPQPDYKWHKWYLWTQMNHDIKQLLYKKWRIRILCLQEIINYAILHAANKTKLPIHFSDIRSLKGKQILIWQHYLCTLRALQKLKLIAPKETTVNRISIVQSPLSSLVFHLDYNHNLLFVSSLFIKYQL